MPSTPLIVACLQVVVLVGACICLKIGLDLNNPTTIGIGLALWVLMPQVKHV